MENSDYASYLEREEPQPPPLPVTEKKELNAFRAHLRDRGTLDDDGKLRAWGHGTLGDMFPDPMAAYRQHVGLGCDLLGEKNWLAALVPVIWPHNKDMPPHDPFVIEPADQAWINAWKFATNWGWFGYGGVAVLWVMSGGNAVLEFIDYMLIIWPCIIFTVIALCARWRVGWPIFLANLWLLLHIVKWILTAILFVCGAVFVIQAIEGAFKKS